VWDFDSDITGNGFITYDLVDEFVFGYNDYPGKAVQNFTEQGQRLYDPTL